MPLTLSSLQTFLTLFDTIEAAFDFVPSSSPPSPIARVRGTLRNARASLNALEGRLENHEPNARDFDDLQRLKNTIANLVDDKWVLDGLATVDLHWEGRDAAALVGVSVPATPLRLQGAVGLVVEGLSQLAI